MAPPHSSTSPASIVSLRRLCDHVTPHRALPGEVDLGHEGAGADLEVGAVLHRVQVGAGRAQPVAAVDVAVKGGKALLLVAVDVVGERIARLLDGGEERLEQRVDRRAALHLQRPVVAAERVVGRRVQRVLHALEVRQAVRVVPGLHARVRGPALVVHRVAALEDHAVDGARPAQHLAARVVDPAPVHEGLGLGLVPPVIEAVADRERQGRRHVDVDVPQRVVAARLQHQHPGPRVRAEPVGQAAAGRAPTDDHVVVSHVRSLPLVWTLLQNGADLALERLDVLGDDRARAVGVAVGDRPQQVAVLVHAREQVRQPVEHQVPDPQRQVEVAAERVLQVRVAGAAMDEAVHARVERHQRRDVVAALAALQLVQQLLELGPLRRGDALGGTIGGVALQLHPHVGDVGQVGDVDLRGERPAAREHRDQVLQRQPLDRLAHRRAPDAQLAPEHVLVDRRPGRDPQRHDPVAQIVVRPIGQQLARDPGLGRRCAHRSASR